MPRLRFEEKMQVKLDLKQKLKLVSVLGREPEGKQELEVEPVLRPVLELEWALEPRQGLRTEV